MMTPRERTLSDPSLSVEEKLEYAHWRKRATPEDVEWHDSLASLWYESKAKAEAFKEYVQQRFAEEPA